MKPIQILLVEDNEGDVFLTKKAFEKARIANNISVVMDGEEAVKFLKAEGEYQDRIKPDIVFLDINLPKKDGKQVLEEVKADPHTKRIPIVVLTSSSAEQDILKSYDLQANAYITKPINLEKFHEIVSATENFWFSVVTLPEKPTA